MRSRFFKFLLWPSLLITLALLWQPAAAQDGEEDPAAITLLAEAGFDGYHKGEYWVPVSVSVANNGPAVEGELRVVSGASATRNRVVYVSPISLPTQSDKRVTIYVYLSNLTSRLTVELVDERDRLVAETLTNSLDRLEVNDLLYGVVSPEPGELSFLENVRRERADAAVAFLTTEDLPAVPAAWNALDVIIFHDSDTGSLTAGQLAALEAWVDTGGQLVVTGGPNWQKTTAALTSLLPVTISGSESMADLPALINKTGVPFRDPGPYIVTISSLKSGELLLHQDGLPLLARQSMGRGNVFFLALDPSLAPLVDWDGSELVWAEVAEFAPRTPVWGVGGQNSYAAGSAVSSLPSLALPSTLQLFLFLFVYVIVVGPVNYLVLRRMRRRELAWFTVPALVVFFTLVAYITGFRLKGNEIILNQVSVVFGHTEGEQVRVQSLLGLYSPRRATYDLMLPEEVIARPFNRDFGGLAGGGSLSAVEQAGAVTMRDVRVDVSGIETFVADSYQPAPAIDGQATLILDGSSFKLDVSIQNNSDLVLERVVLLLGGTAIHLGDLAPGEIATHSTPLSDSMGTAVAGASAGAGTGFVPGSASPLAANYPMILGSSDYFNDSDVFPRYQLLQTIAPDYASSAGWYPRGTVTMIAWSEAGQIEVTLADRSFNSLGTTLYFLELPFSQTIATGQNITVPKTFFDWLVLDESGVYNPSVKDLYFPPGFIEYEFQPWPEFQALTVSGLEIMLLAPPGNTSQVLPRVQLWDWGEEQWVTLDDAQWGSNSVAKPDPFLSPGNTFRVRLQNSGPQGIEIREIYPRLAGDLD